MKFDFDFYNEIFQRVKKVGWSSTALLHCNVDKKGNILNRKIDYRQGDKSILVEVDDVLKYKDHSAYCIPYLDSDILIHWGLMNRDLSELQLYFEITDKVPSRAGSIGLLTNLSGDKRVRKSILSFGNKKQYTITRNVFNRNVAILKLDYNGPTKYIFDREPGKTKEIPPIKTKYNQVLNKGDFVFAAMCRTNKAYLVAGLVTRWTAVGNVFVKPIYNIGAERIQNKNGEVMIASGQEVVKLPQEDVEKHLLMVGLGL